MSDDPMRGRVALITGGGSGVGAATARSLAERGVHTVLTGRREQKLLDVNAALATPGTVIAADITDDGVPERLVDRTLSSHGRLDMVVHAAGVFDKRPIEHTDDRFWNRILQVNLGSVVALTRIAWPHLVASSGQVALISSAAALKGFAENTAYAASKGGMNAVGEVLREEGRPHGIRVLTVCPGQIDTELWEDRAPDGVRSRMMREGGVGDLVAALLASDRSIDFAPVSIQPPSDPWAEPS